MQVVLDVGNCLNAGTAKGNAVGFKLTTLLKLAELKAQVRRPRRGSKLQPPPHRYISVFTTRNMATTTPLC